MSIFSLQKRWTLLTVLTVLSLLSVDVLARQTKTDPGKVPEGAVLLSSIQALTLRTGQLTTGRRARPVPQLTCAGPRDVCNLYHVDVMRCTNEGADYDADNIQWSCKASMPEEFKLGSTDVTCEGYLSRHDPYILKGSCGVEYRLLLTEKGMQKYPTKKSYRRNQQNANATSESGRFFPIIFGIIFLTVLFVIVRGILGASRDSPPRRGRGNRRNDGGDDDPPPPYDDPPAYSRTPKKQYTRSSTATSSRQQNRAEQRGWRPGFGTGLAAGAAAGYATGRMMHRTETPSGRDSPQAEQETRESRSFTSFSTRRHESTGFGGTNNR